MDNQQYLYNSEPMEDKMPEGQVVPPVSSGGNEPKKPKLFSLLLVAAAVVMVVGSVGFVVYRWYGNQLGGLAEQVTSRFNQEPQVTPEAAVEEETETVTVTVPGADEDANETVAELSEDMNVIEEIGMGFVVPDGFSSREQNGEVMGWGAEKGYWIDKFDTDSVLAKVYLYPSAQEPRDWWKAVGQPEIKASVEEMAKMIQEKTTINLKYTSKEGQFAGENAYLVIVESSYPSQNLPGRSELAILSRNGYIAMIWTAETSGDKLNEWLESISFIGK